MSHGRRKRNVDDSDQTEGTLSAIIRVLAKGEDEGVLQNATLSNK